MRIICYIRQESYQTAKIGTYLLKRSKNRYSQKVKANKGKGTKKATNG